MGKLKGQDVRNATSAFFGTLGVLQDRKDRKEDRAIQREEREENTKYREFYMKLHGDQDARAVDSHEMRMEQWGVEQEQLVREAEARQTFFQENNMTFEEWSLLKPVEQFNMQRESFDMSKELNQLQLDTGRFNLQQNQALAPFEIRAAKGRALAAENKGSGADDGALEDQYKLLNFQQKSIQERLEKGYGDGLGGVDWVRAEREQPALVNSWMANSTTMTDLEAKMNPYQREQLGLGALGVGGPGSSEVENGDDEDEFRASRQGPEKFRSATAQKKKELERGQRISAALPTNQEFVYMDPESGQLIGTSDRQQISKVEAYAADKNLGKVQYFDSETVPLWAFDQPGSVYVDYLKEKKRGYHGLPTGRVDTRQFDYNK